MYHAMLPHVNSPQHASQPVAAYAVFSYPEPVYVDPKHRMRFNRKSISIGDFQSASAINRRQHPKIVVPGIDMAPIRSHPVMPPPPHVYIPHHKSLDNNVAQHTKKTGKCSKNGDTKRAPAWDGQVVTVSANGPDLRELKAAAAAAAAAGDCARSDSKATHRSYDDSDDSSSHSSTHSSSPVPYLKNSKTLDDLYSYHRNGSVYFNPNRLSPCTLFIHNNMFNLQQRKRLIHHKNNVNSQSENNLRNLGVGAGGANNVGYRIHASTLNFQNTAPDRYLKHAHEMEVRGEPPQLRTGNEWDALGVQIWQKFIDHQQTINMYIQKMHLWKQVYCIIKSSNSRYGIFLVGSTITGFGTNSSDMDMCLLVRPTEVDQRNEAVYHLDYIKRLIMCQQLDEKIELILAKVPILKFTDVHYKIEVDLNCNNSVGIRNTYLLKCYANCDWRVRPLVLIVKLWARHHNINDAKNMTISSYSLTLMVIHFLQCGVTPPVLPCLQGMYADKFSPISDVHSIFMHQKLPLFTSDNQQTLGELLLGFLYYYAHFDYDTYAISVRLGSRIIIDECRRSRAFKNDPHQWNCLCIEEPFELTNTARSVYDPHVFEHVKYVFAVSLDRLQVNIHDLNAIFYNDYGSGSESTDSDGMPEDITRPSESVEPERVPDAEQISS